MAHPSLVKVCFGIAGIVGLLPLFVGCGESDDGQDGNPPGSGGATAGTSGTGGKTGTGGQSGTGGAPRVAASPGPGARAAAADRARVGHPRAVGA